MSPEKFCSAELIERRNVSDTLAIFRFRTADQLFFTAGQHATIAIEADGDLLERPYSITSSPYERFLEFFVELVPGGLLTPKLWDLRLASTILIRRRIVGQFTLDRTVNRHLMMATVTGVAPFVSIARTQCISRERGATSNDELFVIHGASHSADFGPYLSELEKLSRDGWLKYIPTISRPWEESNWLGETGRVEDVVRKHADQQVLITPTRSPMPVVTPRWSRMSKAYLRALVFSKTRSERKNTLYCMTHRPQR